MFKAEFLGFERELKHVLGFITLCAATSTTSSSTRSTCRNLLPQRLKKKTETIFKVFPLKVFTVVVAAAVVGGVAAVPGVWTGYDGSLIEMSG